MCETKFMFDNFLSVLGDRFRQQYPQGSIVSDLVQIHGDQYVVKVSVSSANSVLVSTLAVDTSLVLAENRAIERALNILGIRETQQSSHEPINVKVTPLPDLPINLTTSTSSELPVAGMAGSDLDEANLLSNLSQPLVASDLSNFIDSPIIEEPTVVAAVSAIAEAPIRTSVEISREVLEYPVEFDDQPSFAEPDEEITTPLVNGKVAVVAELPLEISVQLPEVEPVIEAAKEQRNRSKQTEVAAEQLPADISAPLDETTLPIAEPPLSVTDMIPMINMELKRLGWSKDRGRDYMVSLYNKRASALLSDDELFGLLQHLRAEPIV
jgi:hypothetical protein